MAIILIIDGHKYEVSKFNHPGEGVRDVYLRDYHQKDVTKKIDHYHMTSEPEEILELARKHGTYQDIIYLGEIK